MSTLQRKKEAAKRKILSAAPYLESAAADCRGALSEK